MVSRGLDRFIEAQNDSFSGFDAALAEIRSGRKRGHWIWYVFPQLAGLGMSSHSQLYGIAGLEEATEYLQHPLLRSRFLDITSAVAAGLKHGIPLTTLMGSGIDATKLVSSMTLFNAAAERLSATDGAEVFRSLAEVTKDVLGRAAAQGYPPCQFTQRHISV